MASHETAFRPLEPDLYPRHVNDDLSLCAEVGTTDSAPPATAKVISLEAYKVLRSFKQPFDLKKVHDLDVLLPLINEAHLRPVRFYRGLDEWLLEHHPDQG